MKIVPVKKEVAQNSFPLIQRIREFKIRGLIGVPGQKDTLSYATLAFQIKRGKNEGYSFREIQVAVIRKQFEKLFGKPFGY